MQLAPIEFVDSFLYLFPTSIEIPTVNFFEGILKSENVRVFPTPLSFFILE